MSEGSWYTQGFGGLKTEEDRMAQQYGPPRFWIKAGTKTQIVFIDDEPACIHEHSPKINGSWKNWFTCLKDSNPEDAACCEILGFDTRHYVGYFTIIDCTEWKDQKGNVHNFEIKLLPAKLKSLKLLQSKKEDRDNRLAGRVYRVSRTDGNAPGIGNDYEYDREADFEKMFKVANYKGKKLAELFKAEKEDELARLKKTFKLQMEGGSILPRVPVFNYWEVLKPKSPKDLRDVLRGAKIEKDDDSSGGGGSKSGEGGGGGGKADDDIPF